MKIPYGKQDVSETDIEAVLNVLRSDFLTQGPLIPRFERTVTEYCGVAEGVAVANATAALHIACMAIGAGPGDVIWTSPITFVASANCAVYCGADVDFVDIDPSTYNLSTERLAEKLARAKRDGRLPKAVIPVHLCGQSCDMAAIRQLSIEYGFAIIEDASHAIGGRYEGKPVGDCRYSDITVFSFHPVKIITTAEGGMAVTNDAEFAASMRRARSHGMTTDGTLMRDRPESEIWNYQQVELGYNYRLTDMQAALGVSQFSRLDEFVARRHAIAQCYNEGLSDLPLTLPYQLPKSHSAYHLYPVRIASDAPFSQREVYEACHLEGIQVNLHYIPVHRQPFYEARGFAAGDFPEAEAYHREALSLPLFPALTEDQQEKVIAVIREALS